MNMSLYAPNPTVQRKAVGINSQFGNPGIANQQGTSRVLYDTLPLDGRQEFKFFESVQNRTFPFTNLTQNKLQVGETFALQRLHFSVVVFDEATGLILEDITDLTTAGLPGLYASDFSIYFDTMQTVKPYSLVSMLPKFNHTSWHDANEWVCFDNNLILPTDVQFRCELDTPAYTPVTNAYLRCTWEGFGTILSPKGQF